MVIATESITNPYVGVGLYSIPEAARIIGVNPSTFRSWVKEYYYARRGVEYRHEPVVSLRLTTNGDIITFIELVELMFVKLFRAEGVTMQTIRRAAQRATQRFRTPYPFAVKRFDTDGARVFATLHEESKDQRIVEDLERGQYAFESVVRPFFRKLDYDDENALRYWPLAHTGRVVLDPQRSFGKPIDAETGVPTFALYNAMQARGVQDASEVADWFEVPVAAVIAAVKYEEQLRATPVSFRK